MYDIKYIFLRSDVENPFVLRESPKQDLSYKFIVYTRNKSSNNYFKFMILIFNIRQFEKHKLQYHKYTLSHTQIYIIISKHFELMTNKFKHTLRGIKLVKLFM